MTWIQKPLFMSLVAIFLYGCSNNSSSSSSGCSGTAATAVCDIDTTATLCPDEITLECHAGAKPDAKAQCVEAIKQADEVIYCCKNNAEPDAHDQGEGGGAGGPPV